MSVQGSDVSGISSLLQIHFHWGRNGYQGLKVKLNFLYLN